MEIIKNQHFHLPISCNPNIQMFEYSRTNQGFDSTNLWRHMIRRIHDSASNIRIFGFDRIKMPFTPWNYGLSGRDAYFYSKAFKSRWRSIFQPEMWLQYQRPRFVANPSFTDDYSPCRLRKAFH